MSLSKCTIECVFWYDLLSICFCCFSSLSWRWTVKMLSVSWHDIEAYWAKLDGHWMNPGHCPTHRAFSFFGGLWKKWVTSNWPGRSACTWSLHDLFKSECVFDWEQREKNQRSWSININQASYSSWQNRDRQHWYGQCSLIVFWLRVIQLLRWSLCKSKVVWWRPRSFPSWKD